MIKKLNKWKKNFFALVVRSRLLWNGNGEKEHEITVHSSLTDEFPYCKRVTIGLSHHGIFLRFFFTSNDGPMVSFDDVPLSCPGFFYYPSANTQKKNFFYAPFFPWFFRIHENKYLQKTEKSEEWKKRRTNVDRAHTLSIYIISIKVPSIYNISQNKLGWSGYESDYLHHGRTYTLRVSAPFRLLLHPSFMLQVSLK